MGERIGVFSFIYNDIFLKQKDLKSIWQSVQSQWLVFETNFSTYHVYSTAECFLSKCAENTLINCLLLEGCPTEIKTPAQKDICTEIFIAVVSVRIILTGSEMAVSNLATYLCIAVSKRETISSYVTFFFFFFEIKFTQHKITILKSI